MARFNLAWLIEGESTGDGELPEDMRPALRVGRHQ